MSDKSDDSALVISAIFCIAGALVTVFGTGAHAVAGAILCVGINFGAIWERR